MSSVWNAATYDQARRRLVPCFDAFYGTVAELVAREAAAASRPLRVLDLGAGTGLLSEQILARTPDLRLTLLDRAPDMLERASARLAAAAPAVLVADLDAPLPGQDYDVVMSALAIHHLEDEAKRALFARVHTALASGGIFINAEQVAGSDEAEQALFESTHLDGARRLGSSEQEVAEAMERMGIDRCATVEAQVNWLTHAGFVRVRTYFRWFRFAVYAGWKASAPT